MMIIDKIIWARKKTVAASRTFGEILKERTDPRRLMIMIVRGPPVCRPVVSEADGSLGLGDFDSCSLLIGVIPAIDSYGYPAVA
jgi:hypothetical protein